LNHIAIDVIHTDPGGPAGAKRCGRVRQPVLGFVVDLDRQRDRSRGKMRRKGERFAHRSADLASTDDVHTTFACAGPRGNSLLGRPSDEPLEESALSRLVRRFGALKLAALAAVMLGALIAVPIASAAYKPPPIKHVWVIDLENESYAYTFGAAGAKFAPYLTKTLPSEGALLKNYYGTGHDSLDNYTAQISGQAANYMLNEDCGIYAPFVQFGGENFDKWTKYGQLSGEGCVYPKYVPTIASQLSAKHLSWKEYAQDMGNDPHRDGTVMTKQGPACGHPPLNGVDLTDTTGPANDSYATRHNPFMYFDSITQNKSLCDSHVLSFVPLASNLKHISTTPNYSFVTPNTCFDGHDWPKCQDGTPGRLPKVNTFLEQWIPKITASPAYKANGMIVIVFDESGTTRSCARSRTSSVSSTLVTHSSRR
jgi:hypothetical protein